MTPPFLLGVNVEMDRLSLPIYFLVFWTVSQHQNDFEISATQTDPLSSIIPSTAFSLRTSLGPSPKTSPKPSPTTSPTTSPKPSPKTSPKTIPMTIPTRTLSLSFVWPHRNIRAIDQMGPIIISHQREIPIGRLIIQLSSIWISCVTGTSPAIRYQMTQNRPMMTVVTSDQRHIIFFIFVFIVFLPRGFASSLLVLLCLPSGKKSLAHDLNVRKKLK